MKHGTKLFSNYKPMVDNTGYKMYKVITDYYLPTFEEEISEHMEQGWKLQGGVTLSGNKYAQAMVKV